MSFEARLRSTLESIHATPSASEAAAIIDVARLAASADKRSDVPETTMLLDIMRNVSEMANLLEPPPIDAKIDTQRLLDIGVDLVPQAARELAFACAYLVMIQDLELTEEENRMATALGEALVLEPQRSNELAHTMTALARSPR
jgi:hypothetical protein